MTARALAAPPGSHAAPPAGPTASPGRGRLLTLCALLLVAALHGAGWYAWNRPVALPDWRGPIAGFAFAPFQRGQDGEAGEFPSAAEIAGDLRTIAPLTRRIRTYTV
ncbi:MAG: glycosyl transferase, partial [Belnapia sp.]|nr:glycosyl transferase [Belnapia sp.]